MADQSYVLVNSNINVDVIKIDKNLEQTLEEAVKNQDYMQGTTVLHNSFLNGGTEQASGINARYFSPEEPTSGANYTVYRKTPEQNYYDFVCVMKNGDYLFYDYNISNNNYYAYLCSIEIQTGPNTPPIYLIYQTLDEEKNIEYTYTNWNQWSLCDIEETEDDKIYNKTGRVWNFICNITDEELVYNNSVTIWDTLGKYPKISLGKKEYTGSTFSGFLGEVVDFSEYKDNQNYKTKYDYTERIDKTNRYSREMEKLKEWKEFCNNGNLKLLKDIKGNTWIIQITDSPTAYINPLSYQLITTITFNWVEVMSRDDISIINIGESNKG